MHHFQLGIPLKTTFSRFIFASLGLALLTACSSPLSLIPGNVEKNVLTGVAGTNGKVLAVKIDDTSSAHPQIGIEKADVIYIEQVEGGLTRLATIFSSSYPAAIGPVRSARISDLDILAQYGKVAFAYSGAQSKFLPKIREANLVDLGAEREPATIYYRDKSRTAPTDMILDAPALLAKAEKEGKSIDTVKSVGWEFGDAPKNGVAIESATVRWPASKYSFVWSATEKRWLINYGNQPNLDASGLQLNSKTILVQLVSITDSEYHDKVGGVTPFSNTVGVGFGYLLRDGQAFKINWKRENPESGTTFTSEDGSVAKFAPGQIWVALTDKEPTFTYPPAADSSTQKSK
jgi:hypothetical protein